MEKLFARDVCGSEHHDAVALHSGRFNHRDEGPQADSRALEGLGELMLFSTNSDSCCSNRTRHLDARWSPGDLERPKGESTRVGFAVARYDVRLVQSESSAGGRRGAAWSEEPSDVMQTHCAWRDFLPDAEANVACIGR